MGLFDKHSGVKSKGCEVYKKAYFVIDRRVYNHIKERIDSYLSGGGLEVGLYNDTNEIIQFIGVFVNYKDVKPLSLIIEREFKDTYRKG